ncbi:hypothetical protein [Nostoc punctiforme]|uniref:Uncharacterized protein n=1 Tax=Nostoc punctiforme (strain ATCC 29133 / PCC 73102) TaxID=63737 RepID=B2IT47_NOSP7|nr:hypothetical protein [Nostoc punctiforme]ACC79545.1 hypothetical protein Npun_R0806 [Nostoc punctiforme PCC 73102]
MTQITQVASETPIVQIVSSVSTTATRKTYIPVVEKVLDRILKAMEAAGWVWDGTINMVDTFYKSNPNEIGVDWGNLTPKKKSRKIYVIYTYAI